MLAGLIITVMQHSTFSPIGGPVLCLLASGHDKLLDPALGWNSHEMNSSGIHSEALILELSERSVGNPKSETRQADMYKILYLLTMIPDRSTEVTKAWVGLKFKLQVP